ncbi:DUF3800 domain-containing protein [Flagellimonas oceanensis]|uniref:DUF3800 domain-containing protein n=1 Tax=Flagellimonas oceanensis TaxID=2499163 RepID=UPI003BAA710A
MRTNYFYVDESGNINNDSKLFIHGCIRTDSPNTINDALKKLKVELNESIYFEDLRDRILQEGFHATENHIDMRAMVYRVLPLLDYRSYFTITKKDSEFYNEFMIESKESDFFKFSLKQLIHDRIVNHKSDKNIFYFETIKLQGNSLKTILEEIFSEYIEGYNCEYHIVGKEEENMGIIDYLNYLFFHNLSTDSPMDRMKHNFELVAPKVAVVKMLHNKVFLSRKKLKEYQVSLQNLVQNF